jgi:hypothetical protein
MGLGSIINEKLVIIVNDLKCSAKERRDECRKSKQKMHVSYTSEDIISSAKQDQFCSLNEEFVHTSSCRRTMAGGSCAYCHGLKQYHPKCPILPSFLRPELSDSRIAVHRVFRYLHQPVLGF